MRSRRFEQEARAAHHFRLAERGFMEAIDAGEVYTLGALARLYTAADVELDLAADYARRNLLYKKDDLARRTLVAG